MGVCGEGIQCKTVVHKVSVNTRFLFGHQFSNQSEKYLGLQLQDDGEPIFRFIKNCELSATVGTTLRVLSSGEGELLLPHSLARIGWCRCSEFGSLCSDTSLLL